MSNRTRSTSRAALIMMLGLLACSTQALARDYTIEVVLFENLRGAKSATAGNLYYPRAGSSIYLTGEKAQQAAFKLIEDNLSLNEAAESIKSSGNYRLLRHFAWQQPGLDAKNAQAIRINVGQRIIMYIPESLKDYGDFIPATAQPQPETPRKVTTTTVNGSLKVRLGRFLHVDANLVFTDTKNLRSYRLSQSRKMRSTEFHYIDNPRFGLLVRILPVEGT